jgi:PAS domain S-box-containing protein
MSQRRSSETLSHDTYEQAPIGISYMDRDGRVLRANSAFCKLLGFDTREIESKLIIEITHVEDIVHNQGELERLWRGEIKVIDVEKRYVCADGRDLWVRATTALVRDESGAPSCSVEFLRDISARKDLAAALLQNQRLLRAVITDLPVAIRACDVAGRVFLHNPAAAQLFALKTPDDSAGSTPDLPAVEMFLPDGKTPVPHQEWPLARALRGENVTNVELLIAPVGGAVRTTLGSARRLTDQNGECLGAVAITQDVTEKKKLERELANAQKLESIGQLAAGIAHEINTPTQFIGDNIRFLQESVGEMLGVLDRLLSLGAAQDAMISAKELATLFATMDMGYLREEVPRAIVQSLDGVERISKIVGAMKDFSHPATEKAPYDLNRAILSTITVATNEWKYVADIVTDLAADLPFVPVMPGAFNQVVLNILVNAAHAIGAANATTVATKGVITVSTRKHQNWAEIRIKDSGCGMPQEVRDRIFDPFFTTKGVGKGTGQGLAIAHDVIVKKHHGTITVDTAPGLGTTFVLRLPLEATDAAAAAA